MKRTSHAVSQTGIKTLEMLGKNKDGLSGGQIFRDLEAKEQIAPAESSITLRILRDKGFVRTEGNAFIISSAGRRLISA